MLLGYLQHTIGVVVDEGYHGEIVDVPVVAHVNVVYVAVRDAYLLAPCIIHRGTVYVVVDIVGVKRTAILLYGGDVALSNPQLQFVALHRDVGDDFSVDAESGAVV